jgi:hypothetical protein
LNLLDRLSGFSAFLGLDFGLFSVVVENDDVVVVVGRNPDVVAFALVVADVVQFVGGATFLFLKKLFIIIF